MPGCQDQIEQFTAVIEYKMQFEAKKPSRGRFATLCQPGKYLVRMDPRFLQTAREVESMNEIPEQVPKHLVRKQAHNGRRTHGMNSTKRV